MNQSYQTYQSWKGWDEKESLAPEFQRKFFEKELKRAGIISPGRLLEVGFGNGEMLRCAKELGFEVQGMEILPELVEKASQEGFEVECADMTSLTFNSKEMESEYDAILAFDVLEHLPVESSITFLRHVSVMLKPHGCLLLRFPNGGSPFGLLLQNGDYTHAQAITKSKLEQLVCGTGMKVFSYQNTIRKIDRRSRTWFIRPVLFGIRNIIEVFIGYLYYRKSTSG